MNTFGTSKYLESEHSVVEDLIRSLKDRLQRLKLEEISIRAEIRSSLRTAAGETLNATEIADQFVEREQLRTDSTQNENFINEEPLELHIEDALNIIQEHRERYLFAAQNDNEFEVEEEEEEDEEEEDDQHGET